MIKNFIHILVLVVFILVYLRYFEHCSLYFPTKEIEFLPSDIGLPFEDVYLDTRDGVRINGWFIPREGSRWTILFSHGNGGNISHRIDKIEMLNKLGLSIFIFDYRGYGLSNGRSSEKGLYRDMEAAYDYLILIKKISPDEIILYGESLGGAVAVELAARKKVKALITESVFSSTKDMARDLYPFFPAFIITSKFNSASRIKDISIPKLIIHSRGDEIVPFNQSVKLFEISPEPKRHLILKGGHNTCYEDSRDLYLSGIREFLEVL